MFFLGKKSFTCPVCGYDCLPRPLYNKKGLPNVKIICTCCGFQPGFDEEIGYSFESYRESWIENGAEWYIEKKKPKSWDLHVQLKNIEISYHSSM